MSSEPTGPAGPPWPVLSSADRRVLGVLVEKAKTTPDVYPLSLNALIAGCNQKSNRDPVMTLSEHDVEETLGRCQRKNLVLRVTGARVDRWRHNLYEAWGVEKVDLAILAELLLRGPQTEGELRTRASRMEDIEDLDTLRSVLKPLVQRGLVVYLTPEERRGAVLTHGFHDAQELEHLRQRAVAAEAAAPRHHEGGGTSALVEARAEIESLKATLAQLQADLAAARAELERLRGPTSSPPS